MTTMNELTTEGGTQGEGCLTAVALAAGIAALLVSGLWHFLA